jgi:hypothetical protein
MNKLKKSTIAFFTAIIGALLGAFGGAEKSSKLFRRIGIPLLLLLIGILFKNYAAVLIALYIPIFYIGYGIPDATDSGSNLGRFWYKIFKGNHFLTDIFVKATIGFLFSVILTIIAILKHNVQLLLITIPITILSHVVFGGIIQGFGEIKLFGKKLNGLELARYLCLTLAAVVQLIF